MNSLIRLISQDVKMILYRTNLAGIREELIDPSHHELKDSVILCGSFNPLHEGHVVMMN